MKHLLNSLIIGFTLAFSTATFTGCQTTDPIKVQAAKTILAVQESVNNYMDGYKELIQLNRVSLEDRVAVRDAYQDYLASMREARAGLTLVEIADGAYATGDLIEMSDTLIEILIALGL